MPDEKTLALFRDYGALGALVLVLLAALWRLWAELQSVRQESDARAKRHLDQIETIQRESTKSYQEGLREIAGKFGETTIRQADLFASSVRELNQSNREITAKLLDLADKDLRRTRPRSA